MRVGAENRMAFLYCGRLFVAGGIELHRRGRACRVAEVDPLPRYLGFCFAWTRVPKTQEPAADQRTPRPAGRKEHGDEGTGLAMPQDIRPIAPKPAIMRYVQCDANIVALERLLHLTKIVAEHAFLEEYRRNSMPRPRAASRAFLRSGQSAVVGNIEVAGKNPRCCPLTTVVRRSAPRSKTYWPGCVRCANGPGRNCPLARRRR